MSGSGSDTEISVDEAWRLAFEAVPDAAGQLVLWDASLGVEGRLSVTTGELLEEMSDAAASRGVNAH